jgi:glycosyltransferase involved in cell wall biosynthesis
MAQVSVIVPNYNHARFLEKRLSSIANQSFKDFEVILLDDASTDRSRGVLKTWCEGRDNWRYLFNDKNSGSPFVQWNKGIELATAPFIWVAESDDYCETSFLEKLVPLLKENPKVGIAYGQSLLVDENDKILYSYKESLEFIFKSKAWEKDFIKKGNAACVEWLLHHNPIPNASGILMRKEAFLNAGKADTSMRLNGDWHLYAKILLHYDLASIPQELNYFRVHQATQRSKSIRNASVYQELITINTLIREAIPQSEKAANAALDEFANWWIGNLPYHAWNTENWQLNRRLFKFFQAYKNHLAYRIFLTYVISYFRDFLKFTGLLKPLKKLRSQLFPGKYWDK